MGVYIGAVKNDYSAMQGPAPSGFHVPTKDEWGKIYNIGISLGAWTSSGGNNFKNYLKLPFAGYRLRSSTNIRGNGTNGQYATSEKSNTNNSYKLLVNSSNIQVSLDYTTFGYSVRGFKDKPVIPDNSRTQIYDGGVGPQGEFIGIYHNTTLGVISISSDGVNRITIMDKNLGATTVYNNGDTLSEANCGRYFQWGNNYGFPGIGNSETITTSSGQVNAQNYGPGNYYSSSTFITRSSSPYGWDSSNNYNLWGATTGVKPTSLKNAYIGEYRGYTPNSNTIGYYPLKSDFNDASGNGYNLTISDATITTLGGVACASYSNGRAYNSSAAVGTKRTLSVWVYNITTSGDPVIIGTGANQTSYYGMFIGLTSGTVQISDFHAVGKSGGSLTQNTWHHIVGVVDNTSMKLYVDGVLKGSTTHNRTDASTGISVGGKPFTDQYNNNCTGYISEAIIENAAWTADQVANYFNGIKYKYWIS